MNVHVRRWATFVLAAMPLLIAPLPADAAGFAGAWSVSGTMTTALFIGKVSPVCTFKQSGETLTGKCHGPNGAGPASGLVSGKTISWQWHATATTAIGRSGLYTFNGALDSGGVIRGTWTASGAPGVVGEFTAIRP